MIKHTLVFISVFAFTVVYAQNYNLILKKRDKTIDNFWEGAMIAFQQKNEAWQYGKVTSIKKDSIYIKPLIIKYSYMRADTLISFVTGFALKDIYAFPKPGVVVDYYKGKFRINRKSSSVRAYWLKSGYILRVGALAYATVNIINSAAHDELSIENNGWPLTIAAGVLLTGVILNKTYKPKYIVGKKYHLEVLDLSPQ
jgi:hypothetical protein